MRRGRHQNASAEVPEQRARYELVDLYKIAVEEYRFQVQLNWDRAKYLLAFNTAIIGVGTGLLKISGKSADALLIGLFAVGFVSALLSIGATIVQHNYYRMTRDAVSRIGQELEVGDRGVATTPGARGGRGTWILKISRIQNILYILLTLIAAVNIAGIIYTASR